MTRFYINILTAIMVLTGLSTTAAYAASINGDYIRKNAKASSVLRVFNCGGGKGIKVVKSTHKPSIGKTIMCGAKPDGNGWAGKILNLEDGKYYSVTISNSGSKLKLRGCVLGGFLCENQYMNRVK